MGLAITWSQDPVFSRRLATSEGEEGSFFRSDLAAGTARIDFDNGVRAVFSYVCPCGCGLANRISIYRGKDGHGWAWNGNAEKPTFTPSIQQLNKCRWHGYVTDGEFRNA